MKKTLIIVISIFLVVILGIGGYVLYTNIKKQKLIESIESIAIKMYELDGIDSYKLKFIEKAKYEEKDYSYNGARSYDIKNKTIKTESRDTEYECSGEICKPILVKSESYNIFDGKIETSYSYNENDEIWEKNTYEVEEWVNLVDYSNITEIEIFKDIKSAELIKEENGIKEYKIVISKKSIDKNGNYSLEELTNDATYKIQIKDNFIIRVETDLSTWYNDPTREDYKNIKQIFELYDFNKTEVSIPEEIINTAKEAEQ